MLQPLPLQLAKEFLGDDGESKQPGLNVPILAGNIQSPEFISMKQGNANTKNQCPSLKLLMHLQ